MTLKRFCAGAIVAAAALGISEVARATVLLTDAFGYPDGQLTAHNGGANVSGGLWLTHSPPPAMPTPNVVQVLDGKAIVNLGGSEDVNRPFDAGATMLPGTTTYYAAKFSVTSGASAIIDDNLYFLHFTDGGTVNFRGRLFVTQPTMAGPFTLGVSSSSSTTAGQPGVKWATDLAFDTDYSVVVSYTTDDDDTNGSLVNDGFTSLWVNPASQASTSVTDMLPAANITTDLVPASYQRTLAIRQAAGAGQPVVNLDIVAVATTFTEALNAISPPPTEDADFDGDGDIDGADFLTWQENLGADTGVSLSTGDANGDGEIDQADLAIWRGQYATSVAAAGAVPEPGALALAGCAVLALAARRRAV